MRRRMSRFIIVLLAAMAGVGAGGCALMPPENRPLTAALADELLGDDGGWNSGYLILVPLSPLTLIADGLILRPYAQLGQAGRHTYNVCWRGFGAPGRYASDCATLPVRTIASPLVFLMNWMGRNVVAIDPAAELPPAYPGSVWGFGRAPEAP